MEVAQPAHWGSAEVGEAKMRERERSSEFDADEIFGRTRKGMPLWFKPERFLESSFDAEAVVADLRRFVRHLLPAKALELVIILQEPLTCLYHHCGSGRHLPIGS